MDDDFISTEIDKLVSLIKEKKKVEINAVSKLLNVPVSTIEEWALFLEEEGIISVKYHLSEVYLIWKESTKEEIDKRKEKIEESKQKISEEYHQIFDKINDEKRELASLKSSLNRFLDKYGKRIEEFSSIYKKYEEKIKKIEKDYLNIYDKIDTNLSKLDEIEDSLKVMKMNLNTLEDETKSSEIKEKLEKMESIRKNVESSLKELDEYMKKIEREKANLLKISSEVDISNFSSKIDHVFNKVSEFEEEMRRINEKLEAYGNVEKVIADAKSKYEEIMKKIEELQELKSAENLTIKELEERILKAKEDLSFISDKEKSLMESLEVIRETLESIEAEPVGGEQCDSLNTKLNEIKEELKDLEQSKKVLDKIKEVGELIDDLGKMRERVEEITTNLASEAGDIFSAIDEEMENYKTFEKVRQRVVNYIKSYLEQLEEVETERRKLYEEFKEIEKGMKEVEESAKNMSKEDANQVISEARKIFDLEKTINKIKEEIDLLYENIGRIEKSLTLLSREIKMLEYRTSTKSAERAASLTKEELKNYESKKKELSKLIKNLWDKEE